MIKYIESGDESLCCGCRACEQSCPKEALTWEANKEGFFYPVLDKKKCIECGICEKVCPMENKPMQNSIKDCFAVQHKNEEILARSSSGGVFRLLADYVLEQDGYVVGCILDENNRPILKMTKSIENLNKMQGSKYLSSDTKDVYKQIKEILKKGDKVLFTGAPCQCAGLLKFLKKSYDNLWTADFLCHGMPSQKIFDMYIKSLEKKNNSHITEIYFRDKEKRGWGLAFSYKNGKGEKKINVGGTDPYQYGFVQGYFNRYSCYTCPFRGEKRLTDFTFCDFWGVENYNTNLNLEKGVSAVTLNTEKARNLKENLEERAIWVQTEKEHVAKENPSLLIEEIEKIPELRKKIVYILEEEGWNKTAKKHFRISKYCFRKIWYSMPRCVVKSIKKIKGGK